MPIHKCGVRGCKYKTKLPGNLKRHKKSCTPDRVREQQVGHHCDVPGCKFKTKYKGSLTRHKAQRHKVSNVHNPNNNWSRKRSIDCLLEEEETEDDEEQIWILEETEQTEDANEEQTEEQTEIEDDERVRVDEDGFIITTCKRLRVFVWKMYT